MDRHSLRPARTAADARYSEALAAWQHAFEYYLRLAREEASAGKLRAAAAAVHAAALEKGRLAAEEDHDR